MKNSLNIITRIEHPMVKRAVIAILQEELGYPVKYYVPDHIDNDKYPYLAIHTGRVELDMHGSVIYDRCEKYNLNQFLRLAEEHKSKIYIEDDVVEFFDDCIIVGDYRFSHKTVKEVYDIITCEPSPKNFCVHITNKTLKLAILEKLVKDFPSSQSTRQNIEDDTLLDRDYIALYHGKIHAAQKNSPVEKNCEHQPTIEEFMETVYEQGKRKRVFDDIEFVFEENYIKAGCGVKVAHKTIREIYNQITQP